MGNGRVKLRSTTDSGPETMLPGGLLRGEPARSDGLYAAGGTSVLAHARPSGRGACFASRFFALCGVSRDRIDPAPALLELTMGSLPVRRWLWLPVGRAVPASPAAAGASAAGVVALTSHP
jgi:hypothetical protein